MVLVAERFPGWTFDVIADLTILQFNQISLRLQKQPLPAMIAYFPQ